MNFLKYKFMHVTRNWICQNCPALPFNMKCAMLLRHVLVIFIAYCIVFYHCSNAIELLKDFVPIQLELEILLFALIDP